MGVSPRRNRTTTFSVTREEDCTGSSVPGSYGVLKDVPGVGPRVVGDTGIGRSEGVPNKINN